MVISSRRSLASVCTSLATIACLALGLVVPAPVQAQQPGSLDTAEGLPRAQLAQAINFPDFGGDFYNTLPQRVDMAPGEIIKAEPSFFSVLIPR